LYAYKPKETELNLSLILNLIFWPTFGYGLTETIGH
jgi:hypothetical protein